MPDENPAVRKAIAKERQRIAAHLQNNAVEYHMLALRAENTPAMTSRFRALSDAYDDAARIAAGGEDRG